MKGELENQNLLNELVLARIIFALAIENMTIETMNTNHHPNDHSHSMEILSKKKKEKKLTAKLEQ